MDAANRFYKNLELTEKAVNQKSAATAAWYLGRASILLESISLSTIPEPVIVKYEGFCRKIGDCMCYEELQYECSEYAESEESK